MPNKIVGRTVEQQELKEIFNSKNSEFVAVYGRRRVGKTYLIRSYFQHKTNCIFFQVIGLQKGTQKEQLENFSEEFSKTFYDGMPIQPFTSWKAAFKALTSILEKQGRGKKIILFLDELPWMATPRSGLLEALDHIWNNTWVDWNNFNFE